MLDGPRMAFISFLAGRPDCGSRRPRVSRGAIGLTLVPSPAPAPVRSGTVHRHWPRTEERECGSTVRLLTRGPARSWLVSCQGDRIPAGPFWRTDPPIALCHFLPPPRTTIASAVRVRATFARVRLLGFSCGLAIPHQRTVIRVEILATCQLGYRIPGTRVRLAGGADWHGPLSRSWMPCPTGGRL